MRKGLLTAGALLTVTISALQAASEKGVVVGLSADAITIKDDKGTVTWKVCDQLLTNTIHDPDSWVSGDKFIDVKKGDKVDLEVHRLGPGAEFLCTRITLCRPDAAGVVTEVGKDTITICNDKGKTTAYVVAKDLVDGSRPPFVYSCLYPSKFVEVTKGCRIEVTADTKREPYVILQLDVKKEKDKEK